jgi:hypothetical protein
MFIIIIIIIIIIISVGITIKAPTKILKLEASLCLIQYQLPKMTYM